MILPIDARFQWLTIGRDMASEESLHKLIRRAEHVVRQEELAERLKEGRALDIAGALKLALARTITTR